MEKRFEYGCDICDERTIVLEANDDVDFHQMVSYALNFSWQYAQTDEGEILICPDCSDELNTLPTNTTHKKPTNNIKKILSMMGLASAVSLLFVISVSLIMLWGYDKSQDYKISQTKLSPVNNVKLKPNLEDTVTLATSKPITANEVFDEFHLEADETADVDPDIISEIETDPEKYAAKIEAIELAEDDIMSEIDRELTVSQQAISPAPKKVSVKDSKTANKTTAITKNNITLLEKKIKGSLNATAIAVNLNPKQALAIGKAFAKKINVNRDLTTKDTLSIVYDDNASNTNDKQIKLIQLTSKGKTYQVVKEKPEGDSFKLVEDEEKFADLLDLINQKKSSKVALITPKINNTKLSKTPDKNSNSKTKTKTLDRKFKPLIHGKYAYYTGKIKNTLSSSAQDVGLGFTHVKRLMHIFSYSVNFKRLAIGDRFSVIFDKNELKEQGTGAKILAAEFVVKGKQHQRVRYTDKKGKSAYYMLNSKGPTTTTYKTTTTGGSKNGFLRYPLKFKRISSGFNLRRRHPISRRIRPHKGTDFAAPRGTPVKASGNGIISYAGWQRGYGRVVKIKHSNGKYETVYAHLSRLNKRAKKGRSVKRGKVIGYVGSTGNSTGNHLHYEFRVRNRAVNPMRVKLPKAGRVVVTKTKNANESKRFKLLANRMKLELKHASKKNQLLASAKK